MTQPVKEADVKVGFYRWLMMDILERSKLGVWPWPPQPPHLNISGLQKTSVCLTETESYFEEEWVKFPLKQNR